MKLLQNQAALARFAPGAIEALTEAATNATFYAAPLTSEQIAANKRVVAMSARVCEEAAASVDHCFIAAFIDSRFAGFVVAARHATHGHELDWLMVHPDFHGSPVSRALMDAGLDWLGRDKPIWLTVIQFNARAIRFYEKFGFAVDRDTKTAHTVPHHIMRRPAEASWPAPPSTSSG
ncbi:MAG TPA: GNAT family N-acetyltransferase [Vitreimonas sp.]|uniref:GNAT family N-acetyltransferase n=1 Tax=Vitreimonas sp. TaxID=3069702 RepID=UPI002D2F32E8|nr:GNAT family N-acetyltransferase [Vitreimonas sp.]HYD89806.1 GNAT family N-acetyltransferase [Vitreimonas sp.]